jgi:predicted transcriptional regulator
MPKVSSIRLDDETNAKVERLLSRYSGNRSELYRDAVRALEEKLAYIDQQLGMFRWGG